METGASWTDVVVAVTSIVTAVAAVAGTAAAVFAGVFAFRQLQILREQTDHAEKSAAAVLDEARIAREASLRPVLSFERATLLGKTGDARRFVEITLQNVGPGAALSVQIRAMVAPLPAELAGSPAPTIRTYLEGGPPIEPNSGAQLTSVAPQARVQVYLRRDGGSSLFPATTDTAIVVLKCTYRDVYGKEFEYPPKTGEIQFRPALFDERLPDVNL